MLDTAPVGGANSDAERLIVRNQGGSQGWMAATVMERRWHHGYLITLRDKQADKPAKGAEKLRDKMPDNGDYPRVCLGLANCASHIRPGPLHKSKVSSIGAKG
jgi:hypothetical protein